jgi:hypothetical protein
MHMEDRVGSAELLDRFHGVDSLPEEVAGIVVGADLRTDRIAQSQ